MSRLGNVFRKMSWAVGSELKVGKADALIEKGGVGDVSAFAAGNFGQGLVSPLGVTPTYESTQAFLQFRSWVYNCSSRNATQVAHAHLRLYAARAKAEPLPKYSKYRRMKMLEQRLLMRRVQKAVDPNIAQRWADGEIMEIIDHPFLELVDQVNDFRNQFDMMEETSIFSDCSGNAFWYIVKGKGLRSGIPTELWLLPSQNVAIIPDPKTFIKGYLFGGQSMHVSLLPDEVIHFRRANMKNQYYGMGRVEAAFNEINGINSIAELEADRARNRGVQDLHFQIKGGDLTEQQRNDYAYQFQNMFAQNRRNPIPLLTGGEVDIKNIAWAPRDLLESGSREFSRQCIMNAFGQSTALWSETANRANVEAAIYQWCRFEIDPTLVRFAQKLNEKLLPLYDAGDQLFCAWDTQARDDRDFQLQQATADRAANIRTINEIRKERDLDPIEDERADDVFAGAVSGADTLAAQLEMSANAANAPQQSFGGRPGGTAGEMPEGTRGPAGHRGEAEE